jgi:cytochrome b561/polyisoprenoid-binding protein YceI
MSISNTTEDYGNITKLFHWSIAALILTLIPLGILANALSYDTAEALARKAYLFSLHKTLGVVVFFLALARIFWAMSQIKPTSLNPDRKLEHFAAETVHWMLYGALVLVPLTGWIHHAATTGFAPIWWPFGQSLPFVPKDETLAYLFKGLHYVAGITLAGSLILHIAGALKHHIIDKDLTLQRIWFARPSLPKLPAHEPRKLPAPAALTIWACAIVAGGAVGLYTPQKTGTPPTKLATVASEWSIKQGEIALTIVQFGSKVEGRFRDWNAAITFDPEVVTGHAGKVDVTIAIDTLTLGSVTNEALGAEYLASTEFPTATFKGELIASKGEYNAVGALQIRDKTLPLNFPFILTQAGGEAQMTAQLTLNRLNYGVGASMTDESSLAHEVSINLAVTAQRASE